MATQAHCAYCFEVISASFENLEPLTLSQVEELWEQYHASTSGADLNTPGDDGLDDDDDDLDQTRASDTGSKPAAISRLLNKVRGSGNAGGSSATSSQSNLSSTSSPSTGSAVSSGSTTPASSISSRSAGMSLTKRREKPAAHPLFVTWNTVSRSGHKSLRGCIGTFEAMELSHGLREYATISAFHDTRFSPIPASLLPSLSAHVTLLTDFSSPVKDPLAWTIGQHGLRISFTHNGRRRGATYLPDVPAEQGWTKEETLVSLMQKAGWNGSSSSWQRVWRDGKGELITYEGKQVALQYPEWRAWRDWVEQQHR